MGTTRIRSLFLIAGIFAALGWAGQASLVQLGQRQLLPPWTLPGALIVIALVVLGMAWRVRSRTRARDRELREHGSSNVEAIDPFFATRALLLAKASSVSASGLSGVFVGLLIFALIPPATPSASIVLPLVVTAGASLVLAICGVVAELWCRLPPSDGDDQGRGGTPKSGTPATGPIDPAPARTRSRL
ncbi:DUF3180 domain-containing protein [Pseudoclavibacter sp. CFCC 11306]|uniref:DUF3180 domain-containing protein n=1 Tax=Pseudoclavibacter sp. CFCC 11306 TaxID=1564493 RepID=UPI0013014055|nr:DUF3180 domain-containing protein [Pseudoclavibacter sp. CFCC 11306]KAB1659038.1 DUF3180 domain-containing protein [Pseudoclavibacter sp. CFCC 11306]